MWQLCKAEASTLFFIYFWLCASCNKIVYMYLLWILLWNFEPSETCHSTLFLCTYDYIRDIYVIDFIFILSQYIYICKSVINNYRFENMYLSALFYTTFVFRYFGRKETPKDSGKVFKEENSRKYWYFFVHVIFIPYGWI